MSDEFDELPELVIGSTTVIPFIRPPDPPVPVANSAEAEAIDEKDVIHSDVYHLKYAVTSAGSKRAAWTRVRDRWMVEGLDVT